MVTWLAHASLPLLTAAVFLAVYLGAALVLGALAWPAGTVTSPPWAR